MKPSTIILANIQRMGGTKDDAITAIFNYLDEEYEKKDKVISQCKGINCPCGQSI